MTRNLQLRLGFGLAAMLAAVLLAWGPFGHVEPAHALTNCTVTDALDSEEQAFLTLINDYRAQNGKSALKLSTNLNRAAAWLDVDMASKKYFSHTDSLGRSPSTRAMNCGYPSGAGENIAAGTSWDTAQEAFTAWKNSAGHNANMLNGSYKQIGIGRYYLSTSPYRWYWTTDFGLVDDGTGGTGGSPTPAKSTMTSPTPGSTLHGSATFRWSTASGALKYRIWVGTSRGTYNVYQGYGTTATSATVSNLPTNGRTLYVRLFTKWASGWVYNDYTYGTAP